MERDSLVTRTLHPEVPPRVDYKLTEFGESLGEVMCLVWLWVEKHCEDVEKARQDFERRVATTVEARTRVGELFCPECLHFWRNRVNKHIAKSGKLFFTAHCDNILSSFAHLFRECCIIHNLLFISPEYLCQAVQ
jgi:hypothetical protein